MTFGTIALFFYIVLTIATSIYMLLTSGDKKL